MAASNVQIDLAAWPIVVFRLPQRCTEQDWRGMFAEYDRLYQRRERFHVVNDGLGATAVPSPADRKVIAELSREHEDRTRQWVLGSAIVVPNPILRGAITAMTWLAPPVYKLTYHGRLTEALDEAIATLRQKGIGVPEAALVLRAKVA